MGNTIGSQRIEDLRSYLIESPDVVVHSLLASYKLFKVFHCAHESFKHGGVVVKLFIPNENEEDDHTDLQIESVLKPYRDATFLIQCRFSSPIHPNVVPYETAEILNRSAILLRQYFGRNLHDRLYSQPHLTTAHKKWIAIQILLSLAQLHSVGVIHGDIKNENIFLVGSFHAILTDFSTFIKPVYLPLNDPVAATSLFFESGIKRRRCFIAPERFTEKVSGRVLDEHGRRMTFFDKQFTRDFIRMDIFSAGLAIAELFLDGQHVVDLPELLAYRNGSFDLYSQVLANIPEPTIRDIVTKMTNADPTQRYPSGISCLEELFRSLGSGFTSILLPLLLVSTHPAYANADMRMMLLRHNWSYIVSHIPTDYDPLTELEIFNQCVQSSSHLGRGVMASIEPLLKWSSSATSRFPHPNLLSGPLVLEKLISLYGEGMQIHLNNKGAEEWRDSVLPSRINQLMNEWWTAVDHQENKQVVLDEEILPVLISFLGSTVSACNFTKSKIIYLEMVESLMNFVGNSFDLNTVIADYIVPYIVELILTEPVREKAICCMRIVLSKLTIAETGLFSEYLFPLCLQIDSSPLCVSLGGILVTEATRLSQSNESKRLQAISFFADRIIARASDKNWTKELLENVDSLFSLHDAVEIQNKLIPRIVQWATGKESRKFFCMNAQKISKTLFRNDPKLIDPFLSNLFVDCLKDDDGVMVEMIKSIGQIAIANKSCISRAFIITCTTALIPLMLHAWFEIRIETENVLVNIFGSIMTPVDQFVFLRHLLPEGCRTLLDLSRAVRNVASIVPPPLLPVSQNLASPDNRTLGVSLPTVNVPITLVNPFFRTPRAPILNTHQSLPTIAHYADWRWEISGVPRSLDLGCLSNPDGSLMSLYTGSPLTSLTDLHALSLQNCPCVPPVWVVKSTAWKPENLLLATLNDFTNGGVAVPVVSVDTTDDGRLIVAGGADCTVRFWRTSSLETDSVMQCSRSFKVPNCSRLYKLRTLRNTKSVVIGTDEQMAIFGHETSGNQPILVSPKHQGGHVLTLDCYDTDYSSSVVAACEKGTVVSWDIRTNKIDWSIQLDKGILVPTGLVLGKDARSFVVSGINGNLTVFDNRFLKPVWHYSVSGTTGISTIGASSEPKSIWVSSGGETCLFDIETGGESKFIAATVSPGQPPVSRPNLVKVNQPVHAAQDFSIARVLKSETNARCLTECSGNPWTLITGHNDGVARYWSRNMSGVVCPLQLDPIPAINSTNMVVQHISRDFDGFREESQAYAGRPCTVTEGHRDVISDICIASLQYDIIVTAGRDGLIKIWK